MAPRSSTVPRLPDPDAVNGPPGAAAAASTRSPCTVSPSARSAGPVALARRAPLSRKSPLTFASGSRTAPASPDPVAVKSSSSSMPSPTESRSASRAGPLLLTSVVPRSASWPVTLAPARHTAPSGPAPDARKPMPRASQAAACPLTVRFSAIRAGSGPPSRHASRRIRSPLTTAPDRQTAPRERRRPATASSPFPPLTPVTRAPSRDSWPDTAAPVISTTPCPAVPVARNGRPASSRDSRTSPCTVMPSASSAGPPTLASQAPRICSPPPIWAPGSRTTPAPAARPRADRPFRTAPRLASPSPTVSPAALSAGPDELARVVPVRLSPRVTWAASSWIAPPGWSPVISQRTRRSVPISAARASIPGPAQVSSRSHGRVAARRVIG